MAPADQLRVSTKADLWSITPIDPPQEWRVSGCKAVPQAMSIPAGASFQQVVL